MARNQFPGTCYRCGNRVEAGEGHFERHKGGWRTQHATCAIEHRKALPEMTPNERTKARAERRRKHKVTITRSNP